MKKLIALFTLCAASLLSAGTFIPDSSTVRSMGRVIYSSTGIEYDWCGTRFDFSFSGTSLALRFDDVNNHYDITLDGKPLKTVITANGDSTYIIAENLTNETHDVTIERRTENTWGISTFKGIILDETGEMMIPPAYPERRLLILGDSYSAGYGTEHDSREGTAVDYVNTSNTAKAFGSLVGKHYDADYTTVGFSGKGVIRNANGDSPGKEFPAYYDHLFASDVNLNLKIHRPWDHSKWKPQIAIIHLGINDFVGDSVPPADTVAWVEKYNEMVDLLNSQFENLSIITCGTSVWPNSFLRSNLKKVVARGKEKGYDIHYFDYSIEALALHWHPSVAENLQMANGLIELIDTEQLWDKSTPITGGKSRGAKQIEMKTKSGKLSVSTGGSEKMKISVYSIHGKKLLEHSAQGGDGSVDLSPLSRQIVVINVETAGNLIHSGMIVVP